MGSVEPRAIVSWIFIATVWEERRHRQLKGMVEAGGVEPPSEKRCEPKPTCLAQFVDFACHAWNEQETQPASPINLARALRTERLGPAHCATPLAGPVSKARGSVRLFN